MEADQKNGLYDTNRFAQPFNNAPAKASNKENGRHKRRERYLQGKSF
jgi:hypothetical protein